MEAAVGCTNTLVARYRLLHEFTRACWVHPPTKSDQHCNIIAHPVLLVCHIEPFEVAKYTQASIQMGARFRFQSRKRNTLKNLNTGAKISSFDNIPVASAGQLTCRAGIMTSEPPKRLRLDRVRRTPFGFKVLNVVVLLRQCRSSWLPKMLTFSADAN